MRDLVAGFVLWTDRIGKIKLVSTSKVVISGSKGIPNVSPESAVLASTKGWLILVTTTGPGMKILVRKGPLDGRSK